MIDHPLTQHLGDIILHELSQHALFHIRRLSPRIFCRPTLTAMKMAKRLVFMSTMPFAGCTDSNQKIRTDLSCTIFLSEPEEYEGW